MTTVREVQRALKGAGFRFERWSGGGHALWTDGRQRITISQNKMSFRMVNDIKVKLKRAAAQ